jgi:tetratricopeptide (TPR) repeat protein
VVHPTSARVRLAYGAAAAAVVGALPYLNTLGAGFTFDDHGLVILNPFVPPRAPLLAPFATPSTSGALYRPLTMVTYLLNHRLGGGPFGFHLVNVLLFACATAVAFLLAYRLSRSLAIAMGTALVWAVHPIHTEAVASVTGRAEILSALWMLASLLALDRSFEREHDPAARRCWRAVSLVGFAAALCSKESAAAGVLLVPLVAWSQAAERTARRLLRVTAPYAVVAVSFVAVRALVVGTLTVDQVTFVDNPVAFAPAGIRLATALLVLWQYVGLLAAPFGLSADYSYDQVPAVVSAADPRFVVAVLGLTGIVLVAIACRRYAPLVTFGIVFVAAALVVTANVVAPIGTIKAERLLFLPSFGWCLICGWTLAVWIGRPADRRRLVLAGVLLGLLALGTWTRNVDWRDDTTLLTVTAQTSPRSARAQKNAGAVAGAAGDLGAAERYFRRALAIRVDYEPAWKGLATVLRLTGRQEEARAAARRAAELGADAPQ